MNPKYIFVLGGVMSGIGKGITTASIAKIIQSCGYSVSTIKADPYLNVDAGTMNPTEHGEVFVLDSGLETDQDMGNYERFLCQSMPAINYMTNGMVFKTVIDQERAGFYEGKCVEPTIHITEEIHRRLKESVLETKADVTIIEIGGTIGEYQNAIFIESARRLKMENPRDVCFVMLTYLPKPPSIGELKTKPTQNATRQLNSYGVHPDIIVARSETAIDDVRKNKIASMCGIAQSSVISAPNATSIYNVVSDLANQDIHVQLFKLLELESSEPKLENWQKFVEKTITNHPDSVNIAIVGKYFTSGEGVLLDAYISVIEAIKISAATESLNLEITWLDAEEIDGDSVKQLDSYDGILIPGGFGTRGVAGKLIAIEYARNNNLPLLGLCYGMQLICIEYARNVCGLDGAHTTEIDPDTQDPVVTILTDQAKALEADNFGGSMRLGAQKCRLLPNTLARQIYLSDEITERHRHRYEVNPDYIELLESNGLVLSGRHADNNLVEIAELPSRIHPFYIGVQFHPEFLAQPLLPHPLFSAFIKSAATQKQK